MYMHINIYVYVHVNTRTCRAGSQTHPPVPCTYTHPTTHQRVKHLKDSDERPEQRVEVLALEATRHRRVVDVCARARVTRFDVSAELAAKQMHAQYAETRHVTLVVMPSYQNGICRRVH